MNRVFQVAVNGVALLSFAGQALAQTATGHRVTAPVPTGHRAGRGAGKAGRFGLRPL